MVVQGVAERRRVQRLEVDLEAELLEPARDELAGVLAGHVVRARPQAQHDGLALLVEAHAVLERVAGGGEHLAGLGQVEAEGLARRAASSSRSGTSGVMIALPHLGVAAVGEVHDLLLVHGPAYGLAELGVAQHGVAQRVRVVVAVQADLVEVLEICGVRVDAVVLPLSARNCAVRDAHGVVERARLQVLRHGVRVLVDLEDDLVQGGFLPQ